MKVPVRFLSWCCLAFAGLLLASPPALSQVAGTNVNMVSGTQWPNGDPFLQRQNEPSMAVSTRNPLHILAGANDYRTVDLETVLSGGAETGDAWLGLFKSFDGGLTWQSTLLPGCPYAVIQCKDSGALTSGNFQAGADPVVRAGTNGMFYYAGLAFDRATSPTSASTVSSIFVARYNDLNNNEQLDPITYIDTHIVASGNASQFLDKPAMAVDIPRSGAATCSFTANEPGVGPNGGTLQVRQSFPAGNVYLAFTDFLTATKANSTPTHLMFTRSTDCGVTWSAPVQLNTGTTTSQGSAIAVNPVNGNVYVAWRQFASSGVSDAIMIAQSTNAGKSFAAPVQVSKFQPFDQGTTFTSFRTNAYPTLTSDMFGFVYVAFSARGMSASGDARVVAAGSVDGTHWTPAIMVDNPSQNSQTNPSGRGHQIMPAMTFANGRLTLLYYDLRLDHYAGIYNPDPANPGNYLETLQAEGELAPPGAQPNAVFTTYIDDAGLTLRRHTLDLRVLELGIFPTVVLGPSVLVSQYEYGCCVNPEAPDIEQFKFNVPNLPLFDSGQEAFLGDYIDIVPSPYFVPSGSSWAYNFMPSVNPLFHATWTDNRDVVPPPPGGSWEKYTPPVPAGTQSIFQPGNSLPFCKSGQEGMRNQNIYTAQITGGLIVGAPGNAKPLGNTTFNGKSVPFQRAFPVVAQNVTNRPITVRFSIASQPTGGSASFLQFSLLTSLDITIPSYSSASRSVFVTSTNPQASITVNVTQISGIGGSVVTNGLTSSTTLNPDITNPNITNPNITNPNITNAEVTNPNITNPNITNPNITNITTEEHDITNPNITNNSYLNPNITNTTTPNLNVTNVSATNPNITNPNITNPNITNPNITNPNITNPNITNPDITNGSIQDVIYPITNNGNTTASYTVKVGTNTVPPNGVLLQLIINKLYQTPVANNCQLGVQTHWVTVANITAPKLFTVADPNITNPDITNGTPNEASVTLAPGETAYITLRVVNPTPATTPFNPLTAITPVTIPQAVNTTTVLSNPGNPNLTAPPVYPPLTILNNPTLPTTDRSDAGYSVQLLAGGGKPGADTFTLASGAFPPGIGLSPSGLISGTATLPGAYAVTIQVADSASPQDIGTQTFTLNVSATPLTLQFVTTPPDGVVGQPYNATPLAVNGGTTPYTWTTTGLPAGLTISQANGQISGTPTVANPTGSPVTITATDAATPAESIPYSPIIRIGSPIVISPLTLPAGLVGQGYSFQLSASGGIGGLAFGPPNPATNVLLSSSGVLTIAPQQASSISFSISVHDSASPFQTVTANYTVLFAAPSVNVIFVQQPPNYQGGLPNPNSPIVVHVQDNQGGAIVGANVTLSFNGAPPCGSATLSGTLTQQTQASGNAFFTDISIDHGQIGYTLAATVQNITAVSNPFTVNGFCESGNLSLARTYPTSALIKGGEVLIAGGQTATGASNAADIYDPVAGKVTGFATLVTARFKHTATTLNNGTVLIVGGQLDNSGLPALASTAELFDPGSGTFGNTLNAPHVARTGGHTATLLADGTVLIAGGIDSNGLILQEAEIFDPATGTFTAVGPMNHARYQHTATLLANGQVLIAGGPDNTAELYDPVARTFTSTGSLTSARLNPSGTLLTNGKVLIAGGLSNNSSGSFNTAELYNPAAGTFALTSGNLNFARGAQTATLLPDGTVLLAGGFNCPPPSCGNDILGTAEVYNPSFDQFLTTGSLLTGRWQDTAIALNDGTVLVAGGFGSNNFQSSTERFYSTAPVGPMFFTTTNPVATPTTTAFSNPTAFNGAATGLSVINFNNISVPPTGFAAFNPLLVSGVSFSTPSPNTNVNVTGPLFYPSTPYPSNFIVNSANTPQNPTNQLLITLPAPTFAIALDYGALGFHGASSGSITLSNGFVQPLSTLPTAGQTQFAGFVSNTPINWLSYSVFNDDWVDLDVLLGSPVTVTLPNAVLGTPYAFVLQEQGGVGTLKWIQSGGTLPPGVALSSAGVLHGTPNAPGVYSFTASFTDSGNPQKTASSASLTITVAPALAITTTSLPNGTEGVAYSATINTSGGTPPIFFSITQASFPPGLTITQPATSATSDTLTGTPTQAGTYNFFEAVADSGSPQQTAKQNYAVTIQPAAPTINGFGTNAGNQPQIFWLASTSGDVNSYNIYRSVGTAGGPFSLVGSVAASAPLTFADPNAGSGTFFYVVRAVANNVESVNSNEVSVVIP